MSIKTKRVITAVLAGILVLAMMLSVITPVLAEDLEDLEAQQEQLKQEAEQAEALKNATQEELSQAQAAVDEAVAEMQQLNAQINEVGSRIIDLNQKIADNEVLLTEKEEELAQAQADLKVYYAALKGRIQMMYESDRSSYLELLLSASTISEFFSKLEYISQMVEYDNNIMEELDACRERIQVSKDAIEATKKELEADRAQEQKEQDELLTIQAEKQTRLDELESNELALSIMQAEQEAEHADLVAQLSSNQAAIQAEYDRMAAEEEAKKQENQQPSTGNGGSSSESGGSGEEYDPYDPGTAPGQGSESDRCLPNGYWSTWPGIGNGMLGWPVDCYILSSLFGPRIHPITGEYKNHSGVDFCAEYGQAIYSSSSGVVLEADGNDNWNGGWGNYIMIQHDNGLITVYAHCSSVVVSSGQRVGQGEVIGFVGSTGMSTAPHLHFEVWVGGSRVNPEDYL